MRTALTAGRGVVSGGVANQGLGLPLVSYGGSSLVVMLACVGVLLSIARQCHDTVEDTPSNLRSNPFAAAHAT